MIKNLHSNCKWFFDMRAVQRAADVKPLRGTNDSYAIYHQEDESNLHGTNPPFIKSDDVLFLNSKPGGNLLAVPAYALKVLDQTTNPDGRPRGSALFDSIYTLTYGNPGATSCPVSFISHLLLP